MESRKLQTRLMGSDFELIATGDNDAEITERLEQGVSEIQRIEAMLSVFNEQSVTSKLNARAGNLPVEVPAEVYELVKRCQHISNMSQGAFDISSGTLKQLFNFKYDHLAWPDQEAVDTALKNTGYRHILLQDNNHIRLEQPGMQIGFGAVGKGYAADRVKALWIAGGAKSGVINASGDLTAWGTQPDGSPWIVGIAHPDDTSRMLFWLPVKNASVATSGNYEQYVERDGIRYSHNIDPRTGWPVPFIKSVTVISRSAELSDALATAVTVMGVQAGIHFINQLPDAHCIVVDDKNNIFQSANIHINAKVD
ncbi:FAD:protein FMN transferase [Chitinophaga tropicalis]|uniref:FAD:protein FMN transferase n=1 Tax=Chitinophaga tropicalis TaxID=2683588 RepID=A0A7K1U9H4_9BACT|nr:FAD:protein FMN transferase [Chitinophaga tropicalis]MVT11009.1 FAD:protein FMN transferase [Chitinophaga tropicalis]